ncbi:hypothetical protein ACNR0F_10600 [Kingella kingae]|uniref:hypothetical protein n=1 Tax=Kingella kingae TaxID=504 RepID=UPI003AB7704E
MNSTISRRQFALKLAATHLFINLVLAAGGGGFGVWFVVSRTIRANVGWFAALGLGGGG